MLLTIEEIIAKRHDTRALHALPWRAHRSSIKAGFGGQSAIDQLIKLDLVKHFLIQHGIAVLDDSQGSFEVMSAIQIRDSAKSTG